MKGCEFVFHVATPMVHQRDSQNVSEATVAGVKSIARYCVKSGTVRRLIYTASVVASSPRKDDGIGFKDFIDETCWTPLNVSFENSDLHKSYTDSKTLAERELLSYANGENDHVLEVVSLACGLVGGDTLLSYMPGSIAVLISQIKDNETTYQALTYI
ncbi:hypothetical protein EI008_26475, partial [Escherichia coli]|nr:hypothetical protein [Escherichia coli]